MERTFVMIKPDAVQRGLVGRIIQRFEDVGLKIVAMKMVWADEELAKKHYDEDIERRRGKKVRQFLVDFLVKEGPVVAMVLEGLHAVELVRKLAGETEPRKAQPGTIRGDFAHVSFAAADAQDKVVKNIIHASSSVEDAKKEIDLWFRPEEIHSYKRVDEHHVY